ncbi:PREDICTED: disintegrin and metalloproteinase domain-containing protein 18-like [Condylura cristata]|uniref:disintegrin and metalloproteinase domain-containing protein 18-like n=1 Tax=Condylura cristata TaxID=143302 RepID=UPI000643B733|nr:PREDICTED: disintegrin and metalloproteinase domain-containing protein 18-like [Condylura cristata]
MAWPPAHALLSFLLIISGLGWLVDANHNFETSLLEITIPRKIQSNRIDESEMHVTYAIKIGRKIYTFHLEKQSFIDPHFLIYLYNKSGTHNQDSSFLKDDCFYQGYAAEIPKSVVTISICSGLRGLLQFEDVSYGIEPLESAATYEHMLYPINNNKVDFPPLRGNYLRAQFVDQSQRILVKSEKQSDVALLNRRLKIQIIMDKALYDYMGSEVAVATEKVVYIFGLINTMFSQLKVTVMLSSLEIWSSQNKISSDGPADEVLQRFVLWKEKFLFQRSSDMAYLLIYRDHPNYVGATYHGKACDPKFAAGIALYPKMISSEAFSVIMAQLLGINMGLTYYDVYNCECPATICIMNPEAIRSRGVKFFSSCNMDEFKHIVSQPKLECLQKQTDLARVVQGRNSSCGNGILEAPEQCDCGSVKDCTHQKCCRAAECRLIGSAKCGSGPCCNTNTCTILKRGHVCRKSTDPCDFPEYCDGLSELCVPDMKSLNLEPCNNGTAYCYNGICRDPDRQCIEIFGKFAKVSSHLCSQEVNIQNDIFGTCGRVCNFANVFCGKIVCHWTYTHLVKSTMFDIQYTYLGGHICMSASIRNNSFGTIDVTFVENGTICGEGKYCQDGICLSVQEAKKNANCDSKEKCQGHGVSKNTELIIKRAAPQKNGLLISFYIFLPILILIATVALKLYKVKRFQNREGTVSEGPSKEDLEARAVAAVHQLTETNKPLLKPPSHGHNALSLADPLTSGPANFCKLQ